MSPSISIVTGFLGSGKTTLLRYVLERGLDGRRVALVVNEIGDIGFDGRVVEGLNIGRMIELTSGCICCAIGTDFLLAVEEIIETVAPDLIIVETTGVAEPWNLIRQVRASGLPLDAVVTLVDAANIEHELDLAQVARWQIRAADFLVLNKCDLVTEEALARVRALLREQNSRAALLETVRGTVDAQVLFGGSSSAGAAQGQRGAGGGDSEDHLHEDQISTLLWQSDAPLDRQRIEEALRTLPATIYRAKGYIHCTDAPWPVLVNHVCGRTDYETTRLKTAPTALNQLVFIGAELAALQDALFAALNACADTPERAVNWQDRRG